MAEVRNIAVVGAGLGGLTAAIALRQRGFDVTVYEQAPELGEIGAGIQISPNAMRVLIGLGLDQAFEGIAFEPNRHVVRNWKSGAIVSATQMKGVFRTQYNAGYFGAHRADFHSVLQLALGTDCVRLNARCMGVTQTPDGVTLAFADGRTASADIVIGADGIRSAVRESLFGPDAPRFTGHIVWRGLVPTSALPQGPDRARHDRLDGAERHHGALLRPARRNRELDRAFRDRLARGILVGGVGLARGGRGVCRLASDAWPNSSRAPSAATSGRSTTAIPCRVGQLAARPCWATPRIRCCPIWRRARRRR